MMLLCSPSGPCAHRAGIVSRTRRCLALGGLLLATLAPVRAQVDSTPQANTPFAVSIGDTAQWWAKASKLPVVSAFEAYLKTPEMASDVDYQQFQLELQKVEAELGFPLTFNEMFSNVFSSLHSYGIVPAVGGTGEPGAVVVLKVKDSAKADKIFDLLANKNETLLNFVLSGNNDSTASQSVQVEKLDVAGAKVAHLSRPAEGTASGKDLFVARSKDELILASSRMTLEQSLAAPAAASSLGSNAEFTRLSGKVPNWKDADVQLWIDADTLAGMNSQLKMLSSMPGMAKTNKAAMALTMTPTGIEGNTASSANPTQSAPNIKPAPLEGLNLIGGQPLFGIGYGLVDGASLYQTLSAFAGLGGANANSPLSQFEQQSGISVQNDVVPALGQEVELSLNNFQINPAMPMIPMVDLVIGLQAKDEAKMKTLMGKLESYLAKYAQPAMSTATPDASGNTPAPAPPAFRDVQTANGIIRMLESGLPGIAPTWGMKNGFVVFGLNQPSVEGALGRLSGGGAATDDFRKLATQEGVYSAATVDIQRIVAQIVAPLFPMLAANNPNMNTQKASNFLTNVVGRMGKVSSAERLSGDAVLGKMVVTMQ